MLPLPVEPGVPAGYEVAAARLRARLSERRFRHTLGVTALARALAERFGVDLDRVTLAALLHDAAREEPVERLRELARRAGHPLPPAKAKHQMMELHAVASSVVAREEFGVADPVVLEAIRRHTFGETDLDPVAATLFVADGLEPRDQGWPYLPEELRDALGSLDDALLFTYAYTLIYHLRRGDAVDVRPVHARNRLVARLKSRV